MKSIVTRQGTAMPEATLCDYCYQHDEDARAYIRDEASRADDCDDATNVQDSTGNDQVECVNCGTREG